MEKCNNSFWAKNRPAVLVYTSRVVRKGVRGPGTGMDGRARWTLSAAEYARVGVELVTWSDFHLRCQRCGQNWSPTLGSGEKHLPRGFWICPNDCNRP